jgi:hypothetical protein
LSHAERGELIRKLKDVQDAGLARPSCNEFSSLNLFVRKVDGILPQCIDYQVLNEVTCKDAYPLYTVDGTLDEIKDSYFYTHLNILSTLLHKIPDKILHLRK